MSVRGALLTIGIPQKEGLKWGLITPTPINGEGVAKLIATPSLLWCYV